MWAYLHYFLFKFWGYSDPRPYSNLAIRRIPAFDNSSNRRERNYDLRKIFFVRAMSKFPRSFHFHNRFLRISDSKATELFRLRSLIWVIRVTIHHDKHFLRQRQRVCVWDPRAFGYRGCERNYLSNGIRLGRDIHEIWWRKQEHNIHTFGWKYWSLPDRNQLGGLCAVSNYISFLVWHKVWWDWWILFRELTWDTWHFGRAFTINCGNWRDGRRNNLGNRNNEDLHRIYRSIRRGLRSFQWANTILRNQYDFDFFESY